MTDLEYASYIMEIVDSGKGYEAIKDISGMLYQENKDLKNRSADRGSTIKLLKSICESEQSDKTKLKTIALTLEE